MFKQEDVLDLVRWQGNRWLTGVCGILSQHAADTSDGQVRMSKVEQQARASILDVLLTSLHLTINSRSHLLLNRISCNIYYRKKV
jgi:hypothetical protein